MYHLSICLLSMHHLSVYYLCIIYLSIIYVSSIYLSIIYLPTYLLTYLSREESKELRLLRMNLCLHRLRFTHQSDSLDGTTWWQPSIPYESPLFLTATTHGRQVSVSYFTSEDTEVQRNQTFSPEATLLTTHSPVRIQISWMQLFVTTGLCQLGTQPLVCSHNNRRHRHVRGRRCFK